MLMRLAKLMIDNQSLTESVLEELDFTVNEKKNQKWWCIDGGTQEVARLMSAKLKKKPEFSRQVIAIDATVADPNRPPPVTLKVQKNDSPNKETESREYFAVFNSTTLGAFQRMDLTKAGLLYGTKQAIRSLAYGASCKVGITFKNPWWMKEPFNIKMGGASKTDLPLRVCVYPSYNIDDYNPKKTGDQPMVLLCSYTWAQDAQRLGTLIPPNAPGNDEELKRVLFHNLALLHKNDTYDYDGMIKLLNDQFDTLHAYDWYKDENMSGAFAYFGPGQFSKMWPEITQPNAYGRLYLVGEAASAHHAWIVGALESVVRAVFTLFNGLHERDPENKSYQEAMRLLSEDDKDNKDKKIPKLPFHPLPKEMPRRQLNTSSKDETSDHLQGLGPDVSLTHTAAVFTLAFIESLIQQLLEEEENKAEVRVVVQT
jgi:monoamine oxidase